MPAFRTELLLPPAPFGFGLRTPLLTLGSCFADVMGNQVAAHKLPVRVNPFGTIFNPLSLCHLLHQAIHSRPPTDRLVKNRGVWHHYDVHSRFSATQPEALREQLTTALTETHRFLRRTDGLVLTFGTAWTYFLREDGAPVANCHQVPPALFDRRLLTTGQIAEAFERVYQDLKVLRPDVRIVLTVSPVRHTRDTLPLNQVSKATLRLACHELTQRLPDVHYFPAYELLLDDLRDYRFYQPDMIHPNEVAEAYLWQKFSETYLDAEARAFIGEWAQVRKALAHRPFHPDTPAHRRFLERTHRRLEKLASQADVSAELAEVKRQLETGLV
ncbi:MAG: GSCFA domain-containing protein [Ferruginibacter sp.]|nr:GSCFA domain-containing protein [Cytophagales bacterium]